MGIEAEHLGPLVWRAVAGMAEEGRLVALLDLLDAAPPGNRVAAAIWQRAATPEAVRRTLSAPAPDFGTLDRLLTRVGLAAAEPLLDALAEAEARAMRRQLLDRLGLLREGLGAVILPRLGDPRWYVVRNLLGLLEEIPQLPEGFSPAPFAKHADARVRRQALKLQLRVPADRAGALLAALAEEDEPIARIALAAAQQECPPAAVPLLVMRAMGGPRGWSAELRVLAIRLLGRTRAQAARDALLRLCEGGRSLLGRAKLPPKSPELLAALAALAAGWSRDGRVAAVLARAARSLDAEIRAAAELSSGGTRA
jgi:hypothetical protein